MLDESAPPKRRRTQSAESVQFRAEHRAMVPYRRRIGELQGRAAFAIARAASDRAPSHGALEAEFDMIREAIARLQEEIEAVAPGSDLGPADNCRRALQVLEDRLDRTAT